MILKPKYISPLGLARCKDENDFFVSVLVFIWSWTVSTVVRYKQQKSNITRGLHII